MRIVSVLPSATEIVYALGAGGELVGRSAECDYPRQAARLPVVMRPRTLDADRPSGEIDRRVLAARVAGESLYELDVERLRELRPDVLLTQDLCGVCSVTADEVTQACRRAGVSPTVVSLSPRTLEEVWQTIATVGEAIGRSREAGRLGADVRRRSTRRTGPGGPRVAVVEWLDPPILAGLWTPAIVRAAGGEPVGPAEGEAGLRTNWAEVRERAPDLVVLSPCSFSVERTASELARAEIQAAIGSALDGCRVVLADEAYFSRPGPRLADGVDLVRSLLHGEDRPFPMPVAPWPSAAAEAAS